MAVARNGKVPDPAGVLSIANSTIMCAVPFTADDRRATPRRHETVSTWKMGASSSKSKKQVSATAGEVSVSKVAFSITYENRQGEKQCLKTVVDDPKWLAFTFEKAVLRPFVEAFNAQVSAAQRVNIKEVGWVEIDGRLADLQAPVKSFASADGSIVEVAISLAPESCAYLISVLDEKMETTLGKYYLNKSVERALILPFVKMYNERSLSAQITFRDVQSVTPYPPSARLTLTNSGRHCPRALPVFPVPTDRYPPPSSVLLLCVRSPSAALTSTFLSPRIHTPNLSPSSQSR